MARTDSTSSKESLALFKEVGITDAYFHGARGVNTDPIYESIETRLNELNIEAEVARRGAAAHPVPGAADIDM